MIPVLTLVGPWYIAFRELGCTTRSAALVLTHVTLNLPITVWLMMAFFREIPPSSNEAAQVDGCPPFQAFWSVVLPLAVPGLIAAGILDFIFSWNEFSIALNLTSRDTATVPVAIARFAQQYEIAARADGGRRGDLDGAGARPDGGRSALRRARAHDGLGEVRHESGKVGPVYPRDNARRDQVFQSPHQKCAFYRKSCTPSSSSRASRFTSPTAGP